MELKREYGISVKMFQQAVEASERIAKLTGKKLKSVEVIDKYPEPKCTSWQVLYTFTDGSFDTFTINKFGF